MAEEKDLKQARAAYKALCEMLDEKGWHYTKNEQEFKISCSARGDDLPIDVRIEVDPDRLLVMLLSEMPYTIPEDQRTALAIAVSYANNSLVDGSFDYNYLTGHIVFRMTSSYRESLVGKELFEYMLYCSCFTVDEYNDKFLMIAKSDMSNEEIVKYLS